MRWSKPAGTCSAVLGSLATSSALRRQAGAPYAPILDFRDRDANINVRNETEAAPIWVHLSLPSKLFVQKPVTDDVYLAVVQRTLSGLLTLHANKAGSSGLFLEADSSGNPWFNLQQKRVSVPTQRVPDDVHFWDMLSQNLPQWQDAVRGYIEYDSRADGQSVNKATTLVGALAGIAVEKRLADWPKTLGLKKVATATGMAWSDVLSQSNSNRIALLSPYSEASREMAVAQNAAAVWSAQDGGWKEALDVLNIPGGMVMGYGPGDEEGWFTGNASQRGMGVVASDLMTGCNVVGAGPAPSEQIRLPEGGDEDLSDDGESVYVAVVMTDGDNLGWTLRDFGSPAVPNWYGNAALRGLLPFTWGLPVSSLNATAPDALAYFRDTAKARKDGFTAYLDPYHHIDLMPPSALHASVQRRAAARHAAGINTMVHMVSRNVASGAAAAAYETIAGADPQLSALFVLDFENYANGRGAVRTVRRAAGGNELPVISALAYMWALERGAVETDSVGAPHVVARRVREWAAGQRQGGKRPLVDRVAWVAVQAWSDYNATALGYRVPDPEAMEFPGTQGKVRLTNENGILKPLAAGTYAASMFGEGVKLTTLGGIGRMLKAGAEATATLVDNSVG